MGKEDDITVLAKCENEIAANIVKGVLEDNGVTASVMGDSTANTLLKTLGNADWKVVVRQRDLKRAQEILQATPPSLPDEQE